MFVRPQRFGLEAVKPGKVKIMCEVADLLSCLEMQTRFCPSVREKCLGD